MMELEASMKGRLTRRGFIKAVVAGISGFIGAGIGIPVIGYLIPPSLRSNDENACQSRFPR